MIVRIASPESVAWLAEKCGLIPSNHFQGIEAVDAGGQIHGVVGFDRWTHNAVRMHVAVSHYAGMELIKKAFWYAFVFAKKGVAIGEVAESNRRSRRLAHSLGFRELARISEGWDRNDDLIIYTMRKANCRWLTDEQRGSE